MSVVLLTKNAYQAGGGQEPATIIRDVCPRCKSPKYKKNGHIHNGKQNHHCHGCGRQCVHCCEQYLIAEDKRGLIERLLVERIVLRGICRAVGVTLTWLLGFLVHCCEALPDHLHGHPVSCTREVLIQRLEVEADALASFVQKKANKQGVWIAMDATTRQIIAFHVGDRSHTSAEQLWAKIPQAVRDHRGLPTTCDVMMTLTSETRLPIRTSGHPCIAESDG